jgi:hypothetical protein
MPIDHCRERARSRGDDKIDRDEATVWADCHIATVYRSLIGYVVDTYAVSLLKHDLKSVEGCSLVVFSSGGAKSRGPVPTSRSQRER